MAGPSLVGRVLVAYASAHGSTKGVARAIWDRLRAAGLDVDVRPVDEVGNLESFDAVVLGSAIHNRSWLPEAAAMLHDLGDELAQRPLWLFSVSSVGETSSFFGPRVERLFGRGGKEPKDVVRSRDAVRPREHRAFAGAVERGHWNITGDLFLRAFRGTYGDHRDWQDIEAWADRFAHDLVPATEDR